MSEVEKKENNEHREKQAKELTQKYIDDMSKLGYHPYALDMTSLIEEEFNIERARLKTKELRDRAEKLLSQLPKSPYSKEELDEINEAINKHYSDLENGIVFLADNLADEENVMETWNSIDKYFKDFPLPPLIKSFESFSIDFNEKKAKVAEGLKKAEMDFSKLISGARGFEEGKAYKYVKHDFEESINKTKKEWSDSNEKTIALIDNYLKTKANFEEKLPLIKRYLLAVRYEKVGQSEIYSILEKNNLNAILGYISFKTKNPVLDEYITISYIKSSFKQGKRIFCYRVCSIPSNKIETIESPISPEELCDIIYWNYFIDKYPVKELEPSLSNLLPFLKNVENTLYLCAWISWRNMYKIEEYTPECIKKIDGIAYYSDTFELDRGLEADRERIIKLLIEKSQKERSEYKENLYNAETDLYGIGTGNQLK